MSYQSTRPLRAAVLALTVAGSVVSAPLWAQDNVGGPVAPVAAAQKRVNLDFLEANISDVVKALSIQSGVNIALSPSVKGTVTIRLLDVRFEEALQRVASVAGMDVRRFGTTYYLGSNAELKAIAANTGVAEAWTPKHVPAADVKPLLSAAFPYLTVEAVGKSLVLRGDVEDVKAAAEMASKADVAPVVVQAPVKMVREAYQVKAAQPEMLQNVISKAIPGLNVELVSRTLILSGKDEDYQQAMRILSQVDAQGAAGKVVRLVTLKHLHPLQVVQSLKDAFPDVKVAAGPEAYSPPAGNLSTFTQEGKEIVPGAGATSTAGQSGPNAALFAPGMRSRQVVLMGPADDVAAAIQVLGETDVAQPQVAIEARVVDISPEKIKELGLQYDWSAFGFGERADEDTGFARNRRPFRFGPFGRLPFNLTATLSALEEDRVAKILAKPNITVTDGEDASIFIGDLLRFRTLSNVTDAGNQIFQIVTVPVGIALVVRPRVTDGEIVLKVHPMVSTVTSFVGPERIPQTASREADTTVRLRDGETMVIGGLLREEELSIISKIPGLGDLPILGNLFKHRNINRRKSEITIFLTARIIK